MYREFRAVVFKGGGKSSTYSPRHGAWEYGQREAVSPHFINGYRVWVYFGNNCMQLTRSRNMIFYDAGRLLYVFPSVVYGG